ncbi:YybH family protein [Granulicella paludicola]|uniref:YybH family protein n=1 Tax=Granulicella paludicola TaxID=474951 RepID=UPI0021DF817B|nr:nuclear transport factor 2 family protein [Granulicella paludicola]
MRSFRNILLAATFFTAPLFAQQPAHLPTPAEAELNTVLSAQAAAWNKGDLAAYLGFYKDARDTQAMFTSPIRGLASIRNAYLLSFPNAEAMGTIDESEITVRPMGENFALVTGVYHLTRNKKAGGTADGLFTDILEKTSRGWKIVYSATT